MSEADMDRRIELERKDAERGLLQRLEDILKSDNTNTAYQAAYKRALTKLQETLK